ncbi:peptide ABC transporter substrate-binding protein [Fretibacterium fastidiosum]|uniref:ABC-type oligopeptide transport system, periplasmic component n=1 Tax=Fretibacterium fastidiosum TaxID=651822 RepID=A0AB94IVS3_9BACT|nr:peptide ABC transporter substrate-binding protein [Fretibacterium fastidiosum]CBL27850.1 ABC-type oligopeptide transport system, periplasmic component [Fretibacterium fastidiosum]
MMKYRVKRMTVSSSAAWALSFCLVLSSVFAGTAWAGEPQVLRIPIDEEPDSFNVARVSDYYSAMVASQVIEGLTGIVVRDGREVAVPACAESWETSEDGLTWTFRLREMKWADGEPLRASDFVYGISRVLDPATASPISGKVRFIKNAGDVLLGKKQPSELGLEAPDDRTFVVRLEHPVPYLLQSAAGTAMFPARRDVVEKFGDAYGTDADKVVGCGPFNLADWVHNSSIAFVKNPLYWDADNVKLDRLEMKVVAEESAKVGDFENGGLDLVSIYSVEWAKKLDEKGGYVKNVVAMPETKYVFFNQTVPPFSSPKVRLAFSLALDREEIYRDVSLGLDPAAWGWLPPAMGLDGENFRKLAGDPIKDLAAAHPDPRALLAEGLKELGMSEAPEGLKIVLMCHNATRDFAEYLQQAYKTRLGVDLELDPVEWPVFQERNRNLDYQMGYKSYYADFNDPSSMMDLWITGTRTIPTGWSNERYDALVREAGQSADKALRAKDYAEAERILLEEGTIAPYAYSTGFDYVHPYVKGYAAPTFTAMLYKTVSVER